MCLYQANSCQCVKEQCRQNTSSHPSVTADFPVLTAGWPGCCSRTGMISRRPPYTRTAATRPRCCPCPSLACATTLSAASCRRARPPTQTWRTSGGKPCKSCETFTSHRQISQIHQQLNSKSFFGFRNLACGWSQFTDLGTTSANIMLSLREVRINLIIWICV